MPELVHHAYTVCRDNLSSERILEYIQWLGPGNRSAPNGCRDSSTMYGSVMVEDGRATVSDETSENWVDEGYARYGEWSVRLKQDV